MVAGISPQGAAPRLMGSQESHESHGDMKEGSSLDPRARLKPLTKRKARFLAPTLTGKVADTEITLLSQTVYVRVARSQA